MKSESLKKLSKDARETFQASLTSILEYEDAMNRLGRGLKQFENALTTNITEGEAIELQVRKAFKTAKALLKLCRENAKSEYVPYCLAAIDYFLQSEDAIVDFRNIDGFEDDLAVFEVVIKEFRLKLK